MSLEGIRRKIDSINKTSQITKAMSLVSTTKYNHIVNISSNYELYAQKVRRTVASIMNRANDLNDSSYGSNNSDLSIVDYHDLLVSRPVKTGYLIITSDKGLAGGYNSTIIKEFRQLIKQRHQSKNELVVMAIGEPIVRFCQKESISIAHELHHLPDFPTFTHVQKFNSKICRIF